MAYSTGTLVLAVSGQGISPSIWTYTNTDAHGTVAGAGYFTDGANKGLKANDVVFVVDTDTYTATMHHVLNATTVSAATLA